MLSGMQLPQEASAELFGVHLPKWSRSAWVKGTRSEFVSGTDQVDELERFCEGVISGKH